MAKLGYTLRIAASIATLTAGLVFSGASLAADSVSVFTPPKTPSTPPVVTVIPPPPVVVVTPTPPRPDMPRLTPPVVNIPSIPNIPAIPGKGEFGDLQSLSSIGQLLAGSASFRPVAATPVLHKLENRALTVQSTSVAEPGTALKSLENAKPLL